MLIMKLYPSTLQGIVYFQVWVKETIGALSGWPSPAMLNVFYMYIEIVPFQMLKGKYSDIL